MLRSRTPRPPHSIRLTAAWLPFCLLGVALPFEQPLFPGDCLAQAMVLDYQNRYLHQSGEPDHLLLALEIAGNRAIVGGNRGLAVIDLATLPPNGSSAYLHRLPGVNCRDLYARDGEWFFANLHRGESASSAGFAVLRLVGNQLAHVITVDEPEVLYEKMCVRGDRLYVAAHAFGLRVFDVSSPAAPALLGRLDTGFTDAFAVDERNDTLFVADGAGGLKLVSVADPAHPVLLAEEDPTLATGTSEEVLAAPDGRVFVASGGAGLAVYEGGDPLRRALTPLPGCAESMVWLGSVPGQFLAVGTLEGVRVFDVSSAGGPAEVAAEVAARRGSSATLRICSGVGGAASRLLCANWNDVDVYRLRPAAQSSEADITPVVQRVRFAPEGGAAVVGLRNDGAAPLVISQVTHGNGYFQTDYAGGTLAPGESVSFTVTYEGSAVTASDVLLLQSNDPDENPLPVQLFGRTPYLDPGEPALDFTLPVLRRDFAGGGFTEEPFTLSEHRGKIVWFQVYASW